ncbi:MAG: uroporphyrinogen-III C-methyltransferase [Sideroxydans sp.]|nr:uroporphyrinogen-III C-methyltransferase [Sideroxydans sp.]
MSDQIPQTQSAPSEPVKAVAETSASPANRLGNLIARMTLTQLTLVVLVVVFLWQWFDAYSSINKVQLEVAQRMTEVESGNKANLTLVAQNQELVRELGGKLSLLESKFAETQAQRAALESLYQDMSSSRDQTALAEVEQMLLIAGQQLQLSANVKAALIAMQHAENRLQQLNRPGFTELSQRINRDIVRLRALPGVDVPAINLQLDKLIAAADTLPLEQDARPQAEAAAVAQKPSGDSWWKRFWQEVWQEVRGMVRIENTQQAEMPLLSPTQTFFLRENLKLRLLTARLALQSHDQASFQRELKTAQLWIKRYFNAQSDDTAQTMKVLQTLAASNIAVEVPDISGSLEAVRNYRISHERGAR